MEVASVTLPESSFRVISKVYKLGVSAVQVFTSDISASKCKRPMNHLFLRFFHPKKQVCPSHQAAHKPPYAWRSVRCGSSALPPNQKGPAYSFHPGCFAQRNRASAP